MRCRLLLQSGLFFWLSLSSLQGQFGRVDVTFDDLLLKDSDREVLSFLKAEILRFFTTTVWDEDFQDLEIPLQVQIIFEGTSAKGFVNTYLAQVMLTTGAEQRYFDKAVQFYFSQGGSLFYDEVQFDPLASFLAYYANLILANEVDTYEPLGGTSLFETVRNIALRGSASDYPKGWSNRINLVDELSSNYGLRKLKFAYFYSLELVEDGKIEEANQQFDVLLKGLEEAHRRSPREYYTLYFFKVHGKELSRHLTMLRREDILQRLLDLDPDREEVYSLGLDTISE